MCAIYYVICYYSLVPRLSVQLFFAYFTTCEKKLDREPGNEANVTMQLQCIAAFEGLQAKLQQMKVVLSSLDGENVVGSRKNPGFLAYSY